MKKLLAPLTLLLLVACHPSELERCVEANNNFDNQINTIYPHGFDGSYGIFDNSKDYRAFINESTQEIMECARLWRISDMKKKYPYIVDGVVQMSSTGIVVDIPNDFDDKAHKKESWDICAPKIEKEYKVRALNYCQSQGIY